MARDLNKLNENKSEETTLKEIYSTARLVVEKRERKINKEMDDLHKK